VPIYDQSYRSYDGAVRGRFRWWPMVNQELRIQFRQRPFVFLLIFAMLHFFLRVLQVVTIDIIMQNPNNPITMALRGIGLPGIDSRMFFDFIRIQSPRVFVISLLAGSGMICDDFRNNLMEVYFSKPLTWRDYVLGKTMTLVLIGLAMTVAPAVFLVVLHNLLAPSLKTLEATYWLPVPILAFSLTVVLPCALGILAGSALLNSQRFAAVAVFVVLFADNTLAVLLSELLHKSSYLALGLPMSINRVGEFLFRQRRPLFQLPWGWSALFVVLVCATAFWIVCRRVRRAEIAV